MWFFFLSKHFPACLAAEILQFYASACGQRALLNRNRWAMYANRSSEMETNEFVVTQESHRRKARGRQGTQRGFSTCGLADGWMQEKSSCTELRGTPTPVSCSRCRGTLLDEDQREMLAFLWLAEALSPLPTHANCRHVQQSSLQARSEASGFGAK